MADGGETCRHCERDIYKKKGRWRHRNWWSNNSTFCDMNPFTFTQARPV